MKGRRAALVDQFGEARGKAFDELIEKFNEEQRERRAQEVKDTNLDS